MRTITLITLALVFVSCSSPPPDTGSATGRSANSNTMIGESGPLIYYLEIVTTDVEAVCSAYTSANGLEFGEPDALLGNARTATQANGCIIGVRAPLSNSEEPVIRPYILVKDIESAVAAAEKAGAVVAHEPLEIPGRGTFAIYILGGNQYGLWQL